MACDGAVFVDLRPVRSLLEKNGAHTQILTSLRQDGFCFAFGESAAQALLHLRYGNPFWQECPIDALKLLVWIGEKTEKDFIRSRLLSRDAEEWVRVLRRLGVFSLRELFEIPEKQMNRRFGSLRDRVFDSIYAVWDRTLRLLPEPESSCRNISLFSPETGLYPVDLPDLLLHLDPLGLWLEEYLSARGSGVLAFDLELHFELISKSIPTSRKLEIRLSRPLQQWSQLRRVFEERLKGDLMRRAWPSPVVSAAFLLKKREVLHAEQVTFTGGVSVKTSREEEEWFELFRQRAGQQSLCTFRRRGRHLPEERLEMISFGSIDAPAVPGWEEGLMDLFHASFFEETFRFRDPKIFELKEVTQLIPLERLKTRWWTGKEITRDYYRAVHQDGAQVSIFSENGLWFLSGSYD